MVLVHLVRIAPFTVDQNGARIDKNSPNTSINQLRNTRMEALIIPDEAIPNSAGYPDLKTYLSLEAADGYILNHLDQTLVITYKT